ncbi:hypothetical protein PCL_06322 [Purpureocillium lilacinum]|uniref:Uncharacterized protein n=1 Tax=Purpureocillium lilacinum TaxID=33203 RepID=A0A2U3EMC9_PURLI|nr:hypothetical protein PCL_06322 [Purpureocillium lilacinum]
MLAQSIARLVRACRARTLQQKRGQPSMWQPADPFSCIAQHQHNNARDHLGPATKAGRQAPCSMPAHAISRFVRASFPPCAICWQQLHRNRRGLTKRPPTAELRRGPAPRGQPVKQAQDALSPDDARPTQRGLSDETRPADRLCVAAYQDQARPWHQRFEAVAARRRDAPGPACLACLASWHHRPRLQAARRCKSHARPSHWADRARPLSSLHGSSEGSRHLTSHRGQ